ncbi:Shedu anti-phage system protein SduA domain-containing protein [Citrobacter koseri]|uniref:Shedu immune nuclease family protein n=1 Tax=Citrobacter koseri TaxID=545 RepID=UPI003F48197C
MEFEAEQVTFERKIRRYLSASVKRQVAILSGYRCSFPGCDQNLLLQDSSFIGEIASIEAIHSHGPRHNPSKNADQLFQTENYLLLCPNHHAIIDRQPEIYSTEWLRKAREEHLNKISEIVSASKCVAEVKLDEQVEISLEEAIGVWKVNRENASEEFWQTLLQKCPAVLSQIFPQSMFQLGSKCYVGGKSINNSGGNLVDFIYASRLTGNIVLVEIKTPKTILLGKRYRTNAYSISEELSGAFVQVLNYKDQLMKEYFKLSEGNGGDSFLAFNPKCLIVIGTLESELKDNSQYKSFELFRNSMTNVEIVTYDELFQKAQDILDMIK